MWIFRSANLDEDIRRFHQAEEEALRKGPKCENCEEPIQQDRAVHIGEAWYCDECIENAREWLA